MKQRSDWCEFKSPERKLAEKKAAESVAACSMRRQARIACGECRRVLDCMVDSTEGLSAWAVAIEACLDGDHVCGAEER